MTVETVRPLKRHSLQKYILDESLYSLKKRLKIQKCYE
jgi:hypothetical protein